MLLFSCSSRNWIDMNLICNFYEILVSCRLDVGDGKDLDLINCSRSKLKQQCIRYLGPVCAMFFLSNFNVFSFYIF